MVSFMVYLSAFDAPFELVQEESNRSIVAEMISAKIILILVFSKTSLGFLMIYRSYSPWINKLYQSSMSYTHLIMAEVIS